MPFSEWIKNNKLTQQTDTGQKTTSARNNDTLNWELFKKGNEGAFVEIYNTHFQTLYNYGIQLTADKGLIKDCIQDLFINLRKKRTKLPKVISLRAYLLKCIRNKLMTELKRIRKIDTVAVDNMPLKFEVVPSYENVLIQRQFTEEQIQQIQRSMSVLPKRQKEALYYFYYNSLSYEEIKEIMGFGSLRATRNLVYRALTSVRKNVENHS